jgi:hypothetical protein
VVLIIILVATVWYLWEFQMWKSFNSISFIRDESSVYDVTIFGEEERHTDNADEVMMMLNYFSERKYKRIGNPPTESNQVSNNDVNLYVFHADYGSGSRGLYPLGLYPDRDKILVDTKVYKISPPMNEMELKEIYDSFDVTEEQSYVNPKR